MNNIIQILQEKTCLAFSTLGINTIDWKPNIVRSNMPNVDFTVCNIGSLFKQNTKDKVMDSINLVCAELRKVSDDLYNVESIKAYINFCLNKGFIYKQIYTLLKTSKDLVKQKKRLKILVDYSSPNVAKDMHVGHLRSTIIGDCLANIFETQGHEVLRINHVGDFGLQFGMIVSYIILNNLVNELFNGELSITLQEIYTKAKKLFDTDNDFNKISYQNTVKLQSNVNSDTFHVIKIWQAVCNVSREAYQDIYNKLSVNLTECSESFYSKYFNVVIQMLKDSNLLHEENGRQIIDTPHGTLTIIKSDGGYTYDTTDVTALWYRLCVLNMDKIYYVVDSGQSLHFMQLFYFAKKIGWLTNDKYIEHINFGVVCGEDGKRIRSRNGDTLKLIDLLNYSIEETTNIMHEKGKSFDKDVIEALAYGSIKYADLSINRTSDYIFSFQKMLNFKGNTLAYIMYARVRILAVLRNLENSDISRESLINYVSFTDDMLFSNQVNELNKYDYEIIFHLLSLNDMISKTEEGFPHYICTYLYILADMFHNCYMDNRCISFKNDQIVDINKSRVALYYTILQIMDFCFGLLGVKTIDQL